MFNSIVMSEPPKFKKGDKVLYQGKEFRLDCKVSVAKAPDGTYVYMYELFKNYAVAERTLSSANSTVE